MEKLKITEGPWELIDQDDNNWHDIYAPNAPINDGDIICQDVLDQNAQAICKAVNNTYHKGIDPEGVPDMVEALKEAEDMLAVMPSGKISPEGRKAVDVYNNVVNALTKAGVDVESEAGKEWL